MKITIGAKVGGVNVTVEDEVTSTKGEGMRKTIDALKAAVAAVHEASIELPEPRGPEASVGERTGG